MGYIYWIVSLLLLGASGAPVVDMDMHSVNQHSVAQRGLLASRGGERHLLGKRKKQKKKNSLCAVVLGFDNVIYLPDNTLFAVPGGGGHLAQNASQVIRTAVSSGFKLGITAGNCFAIEMKRILQTELFTGKDIKLSAKLFNDEFFDSDAIQTCELNITPSLKAVQIFHSVRPECVAFLDIDGDSEKFAMEAGVRFLTVDRQQGVTQQDLESGVAMLTDECGCKLL